MEEKANLMSNLCNFVVKSHLDSMNSIPSVPNQTNDPFVWETVNPEDVGLDSVKIQSALDYALQEGGLTQSLVIIKERTKKYV